jgi:hypothetical protein
MDQRTRRAVKQAAAKAISGMGVFLLVAAGYGYFASADDPTHDPGSQITMVVIGVAMAVAGQLLRGRAA